MKNTNNYITLNVPLPSSLDLERKILGQIFYDNDILTDVRSQLTFKDFYSDKHQRIFYAMCLLQQEEASIDAVTVANKLGRDVETIGVSYISELSISEASRQGFRYVISKIKELSSRRENIVAILNNAKLMFDVETDMNDNINNLSDVADNALRRVNKGVHALNMKALIEKTEAQVIEAYNNQGRRGRFCGITDLDLVLGGFENELIIIGARPSMGKTTLTVNILRGLARNYKCLFFSMEQKDTQLITKVISQDTKIDSRKIDQGKLNNQELDQVLQSMNKLKDLNLKIDERAGLGIAEIENAIIREKQTHGLDVVCIDYLQYMDFGNTENINLACTKVVKALKNLTKKHNISIILLSQLSRACEQRADHHPLMSDLRDSGSIEQEADKIMLLYRDVYYNKDSELKDVLEINLCKNRNGAVNNNIHLGFDLERQLVYSLVNEDVVA